jgi:hypothetical protein
MTVYTKNIDHGMVHKLEHCQKVQYQHSEDHNCDLILWLVVQYLKPSAKCFKEVEKLAHITFQQRSDLMLHSFGFSQKSFINRHLLQPPLCTPYIIAFCIPERSSSLAQVIGIVTDISTLGLDFTMPVLARFQ